MTHTTSTLPRDGVMVPGRRADQASHARSAYPGLARMTLHWYVQGFLPEHESWKAPSDEETYYIVERASNLYDELYGGYIEDYMSVGPHKLSKESLVLVPEAKLEEARLCLGPSFEGALLTYKSKEDANRILRRHIKNNTDDFDLSFEPNQKIKITKPLKDWIRIVSAYPDKGGDFDLIRRAIQNAQATQPVPAQVELMLEQDPEDLMASFNGSPVNARDFFSAWEKDGLYFGQHSGSIFCVLEEDMKEIYMLAIRLSLGDAERAALKKLGATVRDSGSSRVDKMKHFERLINKLSQDIELIKSALERPGIHKRVTGYVNEVSELLLNQWVPELRNIAGANIGNFEKIIERLTLFSANNNTIQRDPGLLAYSQRTLAALKSRFVGAFFTVRPIGIGNHDAISEEDKEDKFCTRQIQRLLGEVGVGSFFERNRLVIPNISKVALVEKLQRGNQST